MGVDLQINEDIFTSTVQWFGPNRVKTMTYPGFATDLQPITPLLLRANGSSVVIDTIYPQRTQHVEQLRKMGAAFAFKITWLSWVILPAQGACRGRWDSVWGGTNDCWSAASGVTEISRADNILRGYDRVIDKLHTLGADVEIAADEEVPEN